MINVTSSTAVSWPTPPSAAVVPVSPVPSVPAVQAGGGGSQTGPHSGQGGRGHAFPSPGQRSGGAAVATSEASAPSRPATSDLQAQAAQRKFDLEAQAAREREQQAMEHLKDVLTNVWQASAAVVDRALGRDPTAPGTQSDTAPDLSQVAASLVARKRPLPMPTGAPARPANAFAYDGRGNSSLAPLDPGSHFSQRV